MLVLSYIRDQDRQSLTIPIEIVANAKGSPTIRPKENVDLFP